MNVWSFASKNMNRVWYGGRWPGVLLSPLAGVFALATKCKRRLSRPPSIPVPVVIIGNVTLGGTGKTPLLIHVAQQLKARGIRVGVVSRGYRPMRFGANEIEYPHSVQANDDARMVGDEALLIHKKTQCPVVVAPKRAEAALFLLATTTVDVILSDDGLQHYNLKRDLEVVVMDDARRLGNNMLFPAGPLRESAERLNSADFILRKGDGGHFTLAPTAFVQARTGARRDLNYFAGKAVHACAAIANPEPFFRALEELNIRITRHAFADHAEWTPDTWRSSPKQPIVVTEKDMVKCQANASSEVWALETRVVLHPDSERRLLEAIENKVVSNR